MTRFVSVALVWLLMCGTPSAQVSEPLVFDPVVPVLAPDSARVNNYEVSQGYAMWQIDEVAIWWIGRALSSAEWDALLTHSWVAYGVYPLDTDMVQRAVYVLCHYTGDIGNPWIGGAEPFWPPWSWRPPMVEE
jgi:hypothetical protein